MEEDKRGGDSSKKVGVRRALFVAASSASDDPTPDQIDKLESILHKQGETPLRRWMLKKERPRALADILKLITQCIELGWADVLQRYLSQHRVRATHPEWEADLILKSLGGIRNVKKEDVIAAGDVLLRWLPTSPVHLRTLWIEGLPISVKTLCETLRSCGTLTELRVIDVGIGDKEAKELAKGLAASVKLRRLTLRACKFESSGSAEELVTAILKHPALEAVELSECGFTKVSSDALKRLLGSTQLVAIDLSRNAFDGNGAKFLTGLKGNRTLQWLTLNACRLDEAAEEVFAQVLPQAQITHLGLDMNRLGCGFASASKSLTWLSLARSTAQNVASGIQGLEKSKSLKYLSLAGIDLGSRRPVDQGAVNAVIKLIEAGTPLAHLVLRGCGIRDTADLGRVLRASMFNAALQTLDLANNFNLITAAVEFEGLASNKSLIELDLGSNYFAPQAQEKLWASLARNTTLKVLRLSNTCIDFKVDAFTAWVGSNTSVHTLDVSGYLFEFDDLTPLVDGVANSSVIENLSVDVRRRLRDQEKLAKSLMLAIESNRKLVHVQTNLLSEVKWFSLFVKALRQNFHDSMASLESCELLAKRLLAEWQQPGDVPVLPDDMCGVVWSYLSGPPGAPAGDVKTQRLRLSLKLRLINRRLSGMSPVPAMAPWPDLPLPDLPDSDDEAELSR